VGLQTTQAGRAQQRHLLLLLEETKRVVSELPSLQANLILIRNCYI
jgi:hypothetical protein